MPVDPSALPPMALGQHIEELDRRIVGLGCYIDEHTADLTPGDLVRLLDLHSKMMGRVTRMRQIRKSLEGGDDGRLNAATNQALDTLSQEWSVEL
jgi:hypothetical protein